MDIGQHASIEIKKLANSLREKFKTSSLHPVSTKCCIYRVPRGLQRLHESQCTPRTVSMGPFHYGREELNATEEYKILCLQNFLQRTKVSIEEFLAHIKDREKELRECYAETINLESDEFVKMILVDAIFLIELLLRPKLLSLEEDISFLMICDIFNDIWMLENQLPIFILDDLFKLANHAMSPGYYEPELTFLELTCSHMKNYFFFLNLEDNVIRTQFSKAKHFLDLLSLCLQPPRLDQEKENKGTLSIPTLTELHQAGVKVKVRSGKVLFDIKFENGVLEIPKLDIFTATEPLYRNLLAFELCQEEFRFYLNDYILLMSHLVNTRKDVELLIQKEVTEHWLWDTEDEVIIFQKFVKHTMWSPEDFYYSNLVKQLNAYYKIPWNKWKASLKQNYFNSPWASISVIAAVILLILTFVQTMCSVIAL